MDNEAEYGPILDYIVKLNKYTTELKSVCNRGR